MGRKLNMGNRRIVAPPRQQRGMVLLIALIVLVAMTLAAIGMMRSVDTTTVIAGNVAFKQTTLQSADQGISTAYSALLSIANVGTDKAVLNSNHGSPCPAGVSAYLCAGVNINFPGYAATPINTCEIYNTCPVANDPSGHCALFNTCSFGSGMSNYNWSNAPQITVTDANGNAIATVSYLIQRMCTTADLGPNDIAPSGANICQKYQETGASAPGSHAVGSFVFTNMSVFYRITSKSVGPRNTVAYSQSLVLLPE